MQSSPPLPYALAKQTRRYSNSVVAANMEPHRTAHEPPHGTSIPNTLAYMHIYAIDLAYINPPGNEE